MSQFIKKIKNLSHKQLAELADLSLAAAILMAVGVGISYGGVEKFHTLLARTLPSSQVADVLPCSWFGGCGVTNDVHYGISANVTSSTAGQPVTLTWQAYNNLIGTGQVSAFCNTDPSLAIYRCSISNYGLVGDPLYISDGMGGSIQWSSLLGSRTGSVVVYPTQTTTYAFCGTDYFAYYGGGNYYTAVLPTPCPSVTIGVCGSTGFAAPWSAGGYLIYSGGEGTIYPPSGGRYCVHNYSGNAIFIPTKTAAEWSNFYAARGNVSIGANAY